MWKFTADGASVSDFLGNGLRAHLALSLYAGPVKDGGGGIDTFYLQRLKSHGPELSALVDTSADGPERATDSQKAQNPLSSHDSCAAPTARSSASVDCPFWKCFCLTRCEGISEVPKDPPVEVLTWSVTCIKDVTGSCCACTTLEANFGGTGGDADAVNQEEAVAAARGGLSRTLSLSLAQNELSSVEKLLELEPDCKGALEAKWAHVQNCLVKSLLYTPFLRCDLMQGFAAA